MIYTALLKEILTNANVIKAECNAESLCASHIAVAIANFCKTQYTGFAFSQYCYPRFEDERLRYLFEKEIRNASYFTMRLRHNTKNGVQEDTFNVARCEEIVTLRGGSILSADVVFLCALRDLHMSYKSNVKTVTDNESILALLQDADANIYDYVIEKIDDVRSALKKKSDEAMAIRDWKPAAKFTEPEALASMFFEKIEKTFSDHVMTLKFPYFFGATSLKVSIHKFQGIYYIHDNGCALRHLSKQVTDKQKLARIVKKICHPCYIQKGRCTGSFCTATQFLLYLQDLIFLAQADLYYTRSDQLLRRKNQIRVYVDASRAEPMDTTALITELKNAIHFCYDQDQGLYYWLDMHYSLSSIRCAFLMETTQTGSICISDKRKGAFEGEIFENFYFGNDDISAHGKFIDKIAQRFGGEFDGKNVYLTEKETNFFKAMVKFFNMAVILSLFGRDIALPKRRKR